MTNPIKSIAVGFGLAMLAVTANCQALEFPKSKQSVDATAPTAQINSPNAANSVFKIVGKFKQEKGITAKNQTNQIRQQMHDLQSQKL